MLGGGKKRKKKQYTGPKKQKHVRKKVKLPVLKLYKVEILWETLWFNFVRFRSMTTTKSVDNALNVLPPLVVPAFLWQSIRTDTIAANAIPP